MPDPEVYFSVVLENDALVALSLVPFEILHSNFKLRLPFKRLDSKETAILHALCNVLFLLKIL